MTFSFAGAIATDGSAQIEIGKPFPFPESGLPLAQSGELGDLESYRGEALLLHLYASW